MNPLTRRSALIKNARKAILTSPSFNAFKRYQDATETSSKSPANPAITSVRNKEMSSTLTHQRSNKLGSTKEFV